MLPLQQSQAKRKLLSYSIFCLFVSHVIAHLLETPQKIAEDIYMLDSNMLIAENMLDCIDILCIYIFKDI